ncbi:hypothetical protein IWW36_001681 [Coemansia brasiliensis]|uniref:Glycoside hydrolase family 38 central domain-containing protein n=1 Tax=Coemansia brasiliensis TaxID=2650707 RepID=A0A9W8M0L8_9FUNG|nr:hypothetical protein IWW36_001681 [Coemansia brasiliensis]
MIRRLVRTQGMLVVVGLIFVIWSNPQVLPINKSSWMPRYGEVGPPTSRDTKVSPLPRNLTIHMLPHSHVDAGWNLSIDEYYEAAVRQVLRRASIQLWANRKRRFVWGDVAFLDKWLDEEGDFMNGQLEGDQSKMTWRQLLQEEIKRGQWEIVGGGYVSADEGLTTWWAHNAVLDVGQRALERQLNTTARVAWQIDNFGHFSTVAHLLSNSGYHAQFVGRMGYRDLYGFASKGRLQFLWQSQHTGAKPLLTHFLAEHYASPSADFDFDHTEKCNVDLLLEQLQRVARRHVRQYPAHGHVLVLIGDDFRFVKARRAFDCMDQLIAASSSHPQWRDVRLQYSTASEYLHATGLLQSQKSLYKFGGDMYPYQDKPVEQFWSGILGSRPYLKWLVRDCELIVKHAEALVALARVRDPYAIVESEWAQVEQHLEFARKQLAIGHHHDSITGTCTNDVFADYVLRLQAASRVALRAAQVAAQIYAGHSGQMPQMIDHIKSAYEPEAAVANACSPATRDVADSTRGTLKVNANETTTVIVSNAALLAAQSHVVRLRGLSSDAAVANAMGGPVEVQAQQAKDGSFDAMFVAEDVPALGMRSYTVGTVDQYPQAQPLAAQLATASPILSPLARLHKGRTHVRLRSKRNGKIEVSAYGRTVTVQLREYFANPFVQSSGAYVMHSFGLMYAGVFGVFGAALCAGWLLAAVSGPRVLRALRVPRVMSGRALSAALIGCAQGVAGVYYAAQMASVERLNAWTQGQGVALLIAPVGAVAFVQGGALRWGVRAAAAGATGLLAGTALALLLGQPWQSRALTSHALRFQVEHGSVCDRAYAQVSDFAAVEMQLCADTPQMLQMALTLQAPSDRELVLRVSHGRSRTLHLFDGVAERTRKSGWWMPVPGAFYPAPLMARLGSQLVVHMRQPVGAASVQQGCLDLLVHRNMSANDFRGLRLPLADSHAAGPAFLLDLRPATPSPVTDSLRISAPPLAFAQPHPGSSGKAAVAAYSPAAASLPALDLVGIRSCNTSGGLLVEARLLALQRTSVAASSLLPRVKSAARADADWLMRSSCSLPRQQTKTDFVNLKPGEQALFRLLISS